MLSILIFTDLDEFHKVLSEIVSGENGQAYRIFDVDRLSVPIHGGIRQAPKEEPETSDQPVADLPERESENEESSGEEVTETEAAPDTGPPDSPIN